MPGVTWRLPLAWIAPMPWSIDMLVAFATVHRKVERSISCRTLRSEKTSGWFQMYGVTCSRSDGRRPSRQLKQPQFHCGKPPPAAEPRTRIFKPAPGYRASMRTRVSAEPLVAVSGRRTVAHMALDDRITRIAVGEIALVATDFRAHVDFNEGSSTCVSVDNDAQRSLARISH